MKSARTLNRGLLLRAPAFAVAMGAVWGCGQTNSGNGGDAVPGAVPSDAAAPLDDGAASLGDAGGREDAEGGGASPDATSVDATPLDAMPVDGAPTDSPAPAVDAGVPCKRGIATNTTPSSAFAPTASSPGIAWWYDWSNQPSNGSTSLEFVPMIWGSGSLNAAIPAGSRFLLTFNEPNFKAQSDLTGQQAATDWPTIEGKAMGIPIVSPGVNFCGSAADTSQCTDPAVTDPYSYLKDFLADCPGCEVDDVAVHWYNCDLPSLQAYLEGNVDAGGTLPGFAEFGKPVWLTEFSCDTSHSVADQMAYMQTAIPYLESNPHVFRYSWFSASPIPNAQLMNADGSLTTLGQTYISLPETCR